MSATQRLRLSVKLGEETKRLHRSAERTRAMQSLLKGSLPRPSYALLLRNLHAVYEVLEDALRRLRDADPLLEWLDEPALRRAGPMAEDLEHFHGSSWAEEVPILEATHAYRDAISAAGRRNPLGIVAHAWVRYMGDVSGGQILARLVKKHYQLVDGTGARAYDFAGIGEIEAFKADFRARLDELDERRHEALVSEARQGFEHSIRMLDEVAETSDA